VQTPPEQLIAAKGGQQPRVAQPSQAVGPNQTGGI
jgi:hypothetical protein